MGKFYTKVKDDTVITFGKYKGMRMIDIPDEYFIWLYKNIEIKDLGLKDYIEDNFTEEQLKQ